MNIAYLLSEGRTATTDYFLIPYLESLGYSPKLLDTRKTPAKELLRVDGAIVVVSRYLPYSWRDVLSDLRDGGCRLVYFMDDDLFDCKSLTGLPWRYRMKILSKVLLQKNHIMKTCGEFWVSSSYLANKYKMLNPNVVVASPNSMLLGGCSSMLHVCYHATSSHRDEIAWLAEIVRNVQVRVDDVHFELFGDAEVKRYYRGIPRVSLLHAMSWPEYLSWSGTVRRDIALAPLLPSAFNRGRGPTKFFDYSRLGAAGIYTNTPPYQGFVRDGVDGILLGNEPDEWVEAIIDMATDDEKRKRIAYSARERALVSSSDYSGRSRITSLSLVS